MPQEAVDGFPEDHSLCERCGYSLRGQAATDACPECGRAVAESDPARRTGLAWQRRAAPNMWVATTLGIMLTPRRSFQILIVPPPEASVWRARVYLLSILAPLGLVWAAVWRAGALPRPLAWGAGAAAAMAMLTYIEVLGVTYFSRRHHWRVPWRLAETVACYSAIGWLPATLVMVKMIMLVRHGELERWVEARWPGIWGFDRDLLVLVIIGSVGILWFETLVWLGVRQVRYANWVERRRPIR
jgi:hypothetical protein